MAPRNAALCSDLLGDLEGKIVAGAWELQGDPIGLEGFPQKVLDPESGSETI